MISYTNIVICIEPDQILETWPPIYRGQERPARDKLRLSQLSTSLFSTHTKFCLFCLNLYLRVHPTPSSPDRKSFIQDIFRVTPRQRLTRFYPGNAYVCGLSRHGAYVGSGELDGDQTKAEGHEVLPRFGPLGRVMTYVLLV
jgi:hypothetical protein